MTGARRARSHVVYYELATQKQGPRPAGLPCSTDQTNRSHAPIDRWSPARSLVGFVRVPLPHAATAERARARRYGARASRHATRWWSVEDRRSQRRLLLVARPAGLVMVFGLARLARAVRLKFGTAAGCGQYTYTRAHRMGLRLAMMIDGAHTAQIICRRRRQMIRGPISISN
jgi:hypothetical protein